jgi:hypothetical protein
MPARLSFGGSTRATGFVIGAIGALVREDRCLEKGRSEVYYLLWE